MDRHANGLFTEQRLAKRSETCIRPVAGKRNQLLDSFNINAKKISEGDAPER